MAEYYRRGETEVIRRKPVPVLQPPKQIAPWLSWKRWRTHAFSCWWQTAWAISITQEKSVLTTQRTPFISVTRIQYRLGKQMILFWQWHKILEHTLWQMWRFLTLEYALLRSKSGFKMSVFRVIQCILSISSCSFSNVSPKTPFLDFPNGIHKFHISRTSLEQISKQFKLQ